MPKIAKSSKAQKDALIIGIIRKYSVGLTSEQIAKMGGMSRALFYTNLRNPENFRLGQIRGICKGLKIPEEEMQEALI